MTYQESGVEWSPELRFSQVEERPEEIGTIVRISDGYLNSVVYLGEAKSDDDAGFNVKGTGFLVNHDGGRYIVTAAHVAVLFNQCPFGVRLNGADGAARVDVVKKCKWYGHPDDKVDIAVVPFEAPKWADVEYIGTKYLIDDFKRRSKDIGAGDLAYVIGMFQGMPGSKKNVPVVHIGHIASMADGETVETQDWRPKAKGSDRVPMHGYLIQVPTQSGSSGSPVFVRRSLEMREAIYKTKNNPVELSADRARNWAYGSLWFLGVWHGAWEQDFDFFVRRKGRTDGRFESITIGASVGICTPASRMREALDSEELKNLRLKNKQLSEESNMRLIPQSIIELNQSAGDALLKTTLNSPPVLFPKGQAKRTKVRS